MKLHFKFMLALHNTLTRQIEVFNRPSGKKVGFYACGPTVYDYAHLGNLRTYIFEDILKRVLLYQGFKVRQVMNLTDVDDKTIKRARERKITLKTLARRYAGLFKADIKKLNILAPSLYAPATAYIPEMVVLTQKLLKKEAAYEKNGSIYFNIKKFKNYGRLSQLARRELKIGARVGADNYDKKNPADFVLWKKWTPKDGDVFWQTALGKGRPGWHLECAAIGLKELGQPIDIHAGAVDLIFPHHENEIAEAEAAIGKKFVDFWVHGEHLLVDGRKMAKSSGNFFTLRDLEKKGFNPLSFRYLCLTAHYRAKLNFTWQSLSAAQSALEKIYGEIRGWEKPKIGCAEFEGKFLKAVNGDLNTPEVLSVVWKMIKSPLPSSAKARSLLKFDEILGLDFKRFLGKKEKPSLALKKLLKERDRARKNKNWAVGDRLREKIRKMGFAVEDTEKGQKATRL